MEQHGTGKQKHIMDRVIELVEQRHHDAMNNNPMNKLLFQDRRLPWERRVGVGTNNTRTNF